jgi:hypothetical protein
MNISDVSPKTLRIADALKLNDLLKRAYFNNALVKHTRLKEMNSNLDILTAPFSGTDIILLIGPTGVGKTLIVNKFKERIIKTYKDKLEEDRSFIPVALMEAPSSGERSFAWRIFYNRLLKELKEPLTNKKIRDLSIGDKRIVNNVTQLSYLSGLRECIEDALGYRKTYLVIIDEAVHLIRGFDDDEKEKNVETIKSIANISGTTFLLVGSYDLFELLSFNEQTTRRGFIIHFERYSEDDENEKKAFEKSIKSLTKALPLKNVPDLTIDSEKIMRHCFGCVGTLKDTLSRALSTGLILYRGCWNDLCLEKALLPEKHIDFILGKIVEGETMIGDSKFG